MATIQTVQSGEAAPGRIIINDNFAALNTELGQKETPSGAQAKANAAQAAAISAAATDATSKANSAQSAAESTAAAQTKTAAQISDSSTTGRAVLTGTAAQGRTALGASSAALTQNAQAGSYVLAAADVNGSTEIRQTSATGVNLTINADIGAPLNTPVFGKQSGAGAVTFVAGAGVTLRIPNSYTKTAYQWASWSAIQTASNVWEISGLLAT